MKQAKSRDYIRLFDLVFNQGFDVPCCLNYSFADSDHVFTDFAVARKTSAGVTVGVRGKAYFSCDEWMVNKHFKSIEDMFVFDCKRDNLEWFDTFNETEE
jgi:hypothetical protein